VGKSHRNRAGWAVAVVLAAAAIVPVTGGLAAGTKASSVPQKLVGCWHRHVGVLPTGTSAGVWFVAIKKRGPLAAFVPGATGCSGFADWTAALSVTANRLTIGPTSNAICTSKGTYGWKLSGNSLTLRPVADKACGGIRAQLFTGVWKRK
jgi:hypothetical protein